MRGGLCVKVTKRERLLVFIHDVGRDLSINDLLKNRHLRSGLRRGRGVSGRQLCTDEVAVHGLVSDGITPLAMAATKAPASCQRAAPALQKNSTIFSSRFDISNY